MKMNLTPTATRRQPACRASHQWLLILALALALAAARATSAATLTWTGNGLTPNWSNTNNWNPQQVPGANDHLRFPNTNVVWLASSNDLAGLTVSSISLNKGGYTLSGNPLMISGGIGNAASTNLIRFDTELQNTKFTFDIEGSLVLDAVLSGQGLVKNRGRCPYLLRVWRQCFQRCTHQ